MIPKGTHIKLVNNKVFDEWLHAVLSLNYSAAIGDHVECTVISGGSKQKLPGSTVYHKLRSDDEIVLRTNRQMISLLNKN